MLKQYLEVGKITNAHGVMGEVKVQPWCDSPEFLCRFKTLYVDNTHWPVKVERARPNKNMVILKLEGVTDMNGALALRNAVLHIDRKATLYIETAHAEWFEDAETFYQKLAGADQVLVNQPAPDGTVKLVCNGASLYIPFAELVDIEGEIARLTKELEKAQGELKRVEGKLSNQGFIAKAPAALVEAETAKKEKFLALIADLTKSIEEMKNR